MPKRAAGGCSMTLCIRNGDAQTCCARTERSLFDRGNVGSEQFEAGRPLSPAHRGPESMFELQAKGPASPRGLMVSSLGVAHAALVVRHGAALVGAGARTTLTGGISALGGLGVGALWSATRT